MKLFCRSWMYSVRWSSLADLKKYLDVEKSNAKDYSQQDLKNNPQNETKR